MIQISTGLQCSGCYSTLYVRRNPGLMAGIVTKAVTAQRFIDEVREIGTNIFCAPCAVKLKEIITKIEDK